MRNTNLLLLIGACLAAVLSIANAVEQDWVDAVICAVLFSVVVFAIVSRRKRYA